MTGYLNPLAGDYLKACVPSAQQCQALCSAPRGCVRVWRTQTPLQGRIKKVCGVVGDSFRFGDRLDKVPPYCVKHPNRPL